MFKTYAAYSENVKNTYDEGLRKYFLKVYSMMSAALLVSGISAFVAINTPLFDALFNVATSGRVVGISGLGYIVMFAPLVFSFYFYHKLATLSSEEAYSMLLIYSGLMGLSLSTLAIIYTAASIVKTFLITSSIFAGMSIYGYTTKRDLTSVASFLQVGLIGVIFASVINMFFASPAMHYVLSIVSIVIFIGLTAYDTQKLKDVYYSHNNTAAIDKIAVIGALNLYMDFINLFVHLLRFFGVRRND